MTRIVGSKDLLVETEEVDPHREGWQRHPTKLRVWVNDEGELYIFPPGRREMLVRIKVPKK